MTRYPGGAARRRPAWVIGGYHIQWWLMATPPWLWLWPLPACPIVAAATAPKLPSARARTRIPRIARARADLGDLRCADNLRCAPPAGPLVDVPFHNELRLFIGEGPLFGDIDMGPLRRRSYSPTAAGIGDSGQVGQVFPHVPMQVAQVKPWQCHFSNANHE